MVSMALGADLCRTTHVQQYCTGGTFWSIRRLTKATCLRMMKAQQKLYEARKELKRIIFANYKMGVQFAGFTFYHKKYAAQQFFL